MNQVSDVKIDKKDTVSFFSRDCLNILAQFLIVEVLLKTSFSFSVVSVLFYNKMIQVRILDCILLLCAFNFSSFNLDYPEPISWTFLMYNLQYC